MTLEEQLRNLLKLAVETSNKPIAQIAQDAGISRQYLHKIMAGGNLQISTVDSILSACGTFPTIIPNMSSNLDPQLNCIEILDPEKLPDFAKKKIANHMIRTNRIYDLKFFGFSACVDGLIEATEEYRKLYSDSKTSVKYDQSFTPSC